MIFTPIFMAGIVIGAIQVLVEPPVIQFGKDKEARIEVAVVGSDLTGAKNAELRTAASVGQLSSVERVGNGKFRLKFIPPKERFPQAAILLFEVDGSDGPLRRWVTVPLEATANLKIQTKPRASVKVTVGGRTFGPATADAKGNVVVTAVVPPGPSSARVEAEDRAGNVTVKPLDLAVSPFPRLLIAPVRSGASWARPVDLELYAMTADGTPFNDATKLHAKAERGTIEAPASKGNGRFGISYRAPTKVGAGKDRVTIELEGSLIPSSLDVPVVSGPVERAELSVDPPRYVAGSKQEVRVQVTGRDSEGNPVALERPSISTDFGQVKDAPDGAKLQLPDSFEGRQAAHLKADVAGIGSAKDVDLLAGPPAKAQLKLEKNLVRAGESVHGEMVINDAYDNPVEHAPVRVVASSGRDAKLTEQAKGRYLVEYQSQADDPPRGVSLELESEGHSLARTEEVVVVPPVRPWSWSAGAFVGGDTNLVRADSVNPRAEVAWQISRTSWEAFGDVRWDRYQALINAPTLQPGTSVNGSIQSFMLVVGARYNRPITRLLTLHGSLFVGGDRARSTLTSTDPSFGPTQSYLNPWTGVFGMAGGLSARLGPGRAFAQLEYGYAPGRGGIKGNLLGLGLAAGYLVNLWR